MQNRCVRLGSLKIRVTDVGLVGLLHQFRWRSASAPCPSTYAMCVLPTYPLFLQLISSSVLISTFKPASQVPSSIPLSELPPSFARLLLTRSVAFDLIILRGSLVLDILSHSLVAFHLSSSPLIFAGITAISSLAAGSTPALQSLAICILQRFQQGSPDIGALFGGLSMLTALGQILGVSSSHPSLPPLQSIHPS
jgi:hypothetical protein